MKYIYFLIKIASIVIAWVTMTNYIVEYFFNRPTHILIQAVLSILIVSYTAICLKISVEWLKKLISNH